MNMINGVVVAVTKISPELVFTAPFVVLLVACMFTLFVASLCLCGKRGRLDERDRELDERERALDATERWLDAREYEVEKTLQMRKIIKK